MRIVILLMICLVSIGLHAQNTPPPPPDMASTKDSSKVITIDSRVFTKVEVEAEFPGGTEGWRNFLMTNMEMDKISKKIKIPKGETEVREIVIVKFVVSKDGSVSDISIENEDANKIFKDEAIRVIKKSPNWIPAQQNGRKVNAYRRQPITFLVTKY